MPDREVAEIHTEIDAMYRLQETQEIEYYIALERYLAKKKRETEKLGPDLGFSAERIAPILVRSIKAHRSVCEHAVRVMLKRAKLERTDRKIRRLQTELLTRDSD